MKNDYKIITPKIEHAEACVEFRKKIVVETDFLNSDASTLPDITIEEQLEYLNNLSDKEVYIIAIDKNGLILGMASANPKRKKMSHVYGMGTSVLKEYHGMGIGSSFMEGIIKQVKDKDGEKIVLEVFENNEKAIGLYKKFGFKIEGQHPKGVKNSDGKYYTIYSMGLIL